MKAQGLQVSGGGPIAGPLGSSNTSPLTSVNRSVGSLNDGAHTGTTLPEPRRKQRMQSRDVEALRSRLSERDLAILRSVAEHQFLTVHHIELLHFADLPVASSRVARRTLARLRDLRLLGTLTRRIGGVRAGSDSRVHYLDTVGDQVLNRRSGRHARRRSREPSLRFLGHRLAIADAHVDLVQASRQREMELVECAVEPASWRRYTGMGGAGLTLKADLYAETAVASASDLVYAWFVEIDLGNEGIQTLIKKCRDYESYRRTGIEQEEGGFPIVVWSMTHGDSARAESRRQALRDAIDADNSLPNELFRVIAPDQLVPLLQQGGAS